MKFLIENVEEKNTTPPRDAVSETAWKVTSDSKTGFSFAQVLSALTGFDIPVEQLLSAGATNLSALGEGMLGALDFEGVTDSMVKSGQNFFNEFWGTRSND